MTRVHGPALFLLLLALMGVTRLLAGARAGALVEHELRTRALMGELLAASLEAVARDRPHPGLREPFLSHFPSLSARPELDAGSISYADDGDYLYGLALAHGSGASPAGSAAGRSKHGFVLRAWPLRFGHSGDLEYQAGDDGSLWEGLNYSGRSGTDFGFPPPFPDPDFERPDAGWVPLTGPLATQR